MSNPNQTPPSPYAAERAALLKASPKLQAVGGLHTPASLAQLQRQAGVTQVGVDHQAQAAALYRRPYLTDGQARANAAAPAAPPAASLPAGLAIPAGHGSVNPADFQRGPLLRDHQRPSAITDVRKAVADVFAALPQLRVGR